MEHSSIFLMFSLFLLFHSAFSPWILYVIPMEHSSIFLIFSAFMLFLFRIFSRILYKIPTEIRV